jgi:ribosomal protein S18 acetylase RimI-like enzyme
MHLPHSQVYFLNSWKVAKVMNNTEKFSTVVCRPALAMDKAEVMEISSHIWEGGDYLPQVWDEWLADPQGMLGVAELEGRVVGVFKLTRFQEHEWYMEGLRVHPDFRDRGVASHIQRYILETWHRMGSGMIRLVTASNNIKIHHMCEQSGFTRIAEFIPYRVDILEDITGNFTPLHQDEVSHAFEFVSNSQTHALSRGLINLGWVYANPQQKHFQEAIDEGHAWWWKGGVGYISIWEDEDEGERDPGIELLACPVDMLADILMDYRRLMGQVGYKTAGWTAPNQPEVISALEKAGFQRSWDISLFVYELKT